MRNKLIFPQYKLNAYVTDKAVGKLNYRIDVQFWFSVDNMSVRFNTVESIFGMPNTLSHLKTIVVLDVFLSDAFQRVYYLEYYFNP